MKRRAFLSTLAGAFAFDPERLLWRPGKRLISIPAPGQPQLLRKIRLGSLITIEGVYMPGSNAVLQPYRVLRTVCCDCSDRVFAPYRYLRVPHFSAEQGRRFLPDLLPTVRLRAFGT